MTQAFVLYFAWSTKNAVLSRVQRLREPKYLLGLIAALGWVALQFWNVTRARRNVGSSAPLDADALLIGEVGFTLILLARMLWPWISPSKGTPITFTETEVQLLFPAPVSRRALINLRVAKIQPRIILAASLFALFGRAGHRPFVAVTLWLMFTFLSLYKAGTFLAKRALAEQGVSALKRVGWAAALMAAGVTAVVVSARWYLPPLPVDPSVEAIAAWLRSAFDAGPLAWLLLPVRAIVHPAFAPDAARFVPRLLPALGMVALCYYWTIRIDAGFEDGAIERAEKLARRVAAAREGNLRLTTRRRHRVGRPAFRLRPLGRPVVVLVWKSLTCMRRSREGFVALLLPLLIVVPMLLTRGSMTSTRSREIHESMTATIAFGFAFLFSLMGSALANDARHDFFQLEAVKPLPVPGWAVVVGGLAPVTVRLVFTQWILVAAGCLSLTHFWSMPVPLHARVIVAFSAGLLLPCLTLASSIMQTAAALVWPAWFMVRPTQRRGIEAQGQSALLSLLLVLTLLALALVTMPGALVGGVVFLAGYWLVGWFVVPVAALATAAVLLVEAGFAIEKLGRMFEALDPSVELRGALAA